MKFLFCGQIKSGTILLHPTIRVTRAAGDKLAAVPRAHAACWSASTLATARSVGTGHHASIMRGI